MEDKFILPDKIKKYSYVIETEKYKLYLIGYTNIDKFVSELNIINILESDCFKNNQLVGDFSFILFLEKTVYIGCFGHQRLYITYEKHKYTIYDTYEQSRYNNRINFYELITITNKSYKIEFLDYLIHEKYIQLNNMIENNIDRNIEIYDKKLEEATNNYIIYSTKLNTSNKIQKKYKVKILKETSNDFKNISDLVNNFHSKFCLKNYVIYPELDIDLIIYMCKINEIYEVSLHQELMNVIMNQDYFIIYDNQYNKIIIRKLRFL